MKILKGALGDLEEEAIYSRRLICSLLAALHGEGWVLMMSTDVSKVTWDTDTLIFRHQSPAPAACEWFSIAFSSSNRLRFIDAPASVYLPIVQRLGKNKVGIKCKEHRVEGCYEVKLAGLGWGSVNWDSAKLRLVLLDILEVMEEEGWTVYASIDQKVGGEREGDTDTVSAFVFMLAFDLLTQFSGIVADLKDGRRAHPFITTESDKALAVSLWI